MTSRLSEVSPHDHVVPDAAVTSLRVPLGEGCFRTRPSCNDRLPSMGAWDVAHVAEQEIIDYYRRRNPQ